MKKTKMMKKNYEFRFVLTKGSYYKGNYIEAFIKENRKKYNLLGVAVSVKTAKAVRRNRIKRLIRESYRKIEEDLNIGQSIVFLWKKGISIDDACFKNVNLDMNEIFKKAKMLNRNKNEKSID